MPSLNVDDNSCTKCGICAANCPMRVIVVPGELPAFVPGGADRCVVCGHCEALCPSNAITIQDAALSERTYPAPKVELAADQLGEYLRLRRSIRSYRQTPVPRERLEELMDVVRYAPTARNTQTVRWLLVHDTAELRRLTALGIDWMRHVRDTDAQASSAYNFAELVQAWERGDDPICRMAPHLVIAYGHKDAPFVQRDAIIALSYLDAAAPALGLGTCWGGFFHAAATNWQPLLDALQLPAECVPVYAMMIGYPSVRYRRIPRRNPIDIGWR